MEDHAEATAGVECPKDAGVIDETPAAYKPTDAVMAAQTDLVGSVHTLKQVACVKVCGAAMTWPTIFLREEITAGCAKRPYRTRWRLWTGPNGRAVYLHHFSCSDWARDLHEHRKIFGSIGPCGGYMEETVAPGEAALASRLLRRRGLLRRAGRSNSPSTRRFWSR